MTAPAPAAKAGVLNVTVELLKRLTVPEVTDTDAAEAMALVLDRASRFEAWLLNVIVPLKSLGWESLTMPGVVDPLPMLKLELPVMALAAVSFSVAVPLTLIALDVIAP